PPPSCLPSRLAARGIECNHVCVAAVAVAVDDQQVPIEGRRSTVAMLRLIPKVRRPQDLARRAERRRAFSAKVHEYSIAIDDWRWRCPAVLRIDVSGIVEAEDFDVDDLAPGRDVKGESAQ